MGVRPFCLWPQRTLDFVTSQIAVMLDRWQEDWGLARGIHLEAAAVARPHKVSIQPTHWRMAVRDGGKCWFGWNPSLAPALSSTLYGTDGRHTLASGGIAAEAGAACIAGLTEQLWTGLRAHPADAAPPPDEVWQPGSGVLMLIVKRGNGVGCVVLDRGVILQLCPPTVAPALPVPAPVPATALLANRTVSLQVSPGTVRLSLAEVCSLAVGDVIALDAPLDQPLQLLTPAGATVCAARLLRDGNRKVVSVCPN